MSPGSTVETLECGTSLAELEHRVDNEDSRRQTAQQATSTVDSIDDLRETLAADVLTTTSPLETFTSPFEVPLSMKHQSSNKDSKFFQVPLVYCDQTASNRPVRSIENYMKSTCLPLYGNTHTNTSITGSQSTAFVSEARQIVAEATNAKITGKASVDTVLFAGNGTTSAVELLIDCLGLKHYPKETNSRPVVFIGPYEHHSNLLPWRESGCEIVMVPESHQTRSVDLEALERLLTKPEYSNRLKMGTFTAASNVTGQVSDVDAIASILHKHGALAFFDYATGAPYMPVNMNPPPNQQYPSASLIAKDAVFISPHKMYGGIGTPGVLVIKKHLVNQVNAPSRSGGGTVFYVTNTHHRFLSNRIERYEGGTPNISGIMRCGLTFLLKRKAEDKYLILQQRETMTLPPSLLEYEYATHEHVVARLRQGAPNLVLLGNDGNSNQHLPIFSFLIRCGKRFLHYNYVCAILNDVFGIQSRGGCQCSGPYSQRILGLTDMNANGEETPNERNQQVEHALVHYKERAELLRPGYTRLSLPFKGVRNEEVEYVIKALEWVSQHGWSLMCQYRCNHRTGEWRHYTRQGKPLGRAERKWLSHYDFVGSPVDDEKQSIDAPVQSVLDQTLQNADILLEEARRNQSSIAQAFKMSESAAVSGTEDLLLEELRWFVYPKECAAYLSKGLTTVPETDSAEILGAISPVTSDTAEPAFTLAPVASATNAVDAEAMAAVASRKRKTSEEKNATGGKDADGVAETKVVNFRDGEHCSQAPLDEVLIGIDDGELSEQCEIFDEKSDSWMLVAAFLLLEKKPKMELNATSSHADPMPMEVDSKPQATTEAKQLPKAFGQMKDEKNQKKKPTRDSSTWGHSSFVPVTANQYNEEEKKSGEEGSPQTQALIAPVPGLVPTKKKKGKGLKPPAKLMRTCTQAMIQWDMLHEGDRLLLGLSGGKDSLSLLHCLLEFQRKLHINFEIEVCTIDPMTPSFDPSPLIPYVESLGLKYHYIRDDIVARANTSGKDGKIVSSLCAFCARMKRGNLYNCARSNNCNKLVLAQHLDDCAESFLMSVMHNGFLRTMKANYQINAGDISVIRPLVYCRESLMTEFAKSANLPIINENCPACFEEPKERARIKKLLTREETLYPNFYDNMRRSLIPLMHEDATAILRCYTEETVAKSRKNVHPKDARKDRTRRHLKQDQSKVAATRMEEKTKARQEHDAKRAKTVLSEASDDDLVKELARRKADKFRLSGSMKGGGGEEDKGGAELPPDPTGQVCSLNGTDGSIPCRELME